jgi:hypothetical protein
MLTTHFTIDANDITASSHVSVAILVQVLASRSAFLYFASFVPLWVVWRKSFSEPRPRKWRAKKTFAPHLRPVSVGRELLVNKADLVLLIDVETSGCLS